MITRSKQERELMDKMLAGVAGWKPRGKYQRLCGFMAMIGEKATGELMVVGRAVNGWGAAFDASEFGSPDFRRSALDSILESVNGKEYGQMRWLVDVKANGYNSKRSAFIRVMKRVALGCGIPELENDRVAWPLHTIWSNLYKIAPCISVGGQAHNGPNPYGDLALKQLERCQKLLELEINTYRPKRVLFLTGSDWFRDFWDSRLVLRPLDASSRKYKMGVGDFTGFWEDGCDSRFVVAPHPQGKPEAPLVSDIIRGFGA